MVTTASVAARLSGGGTRGLSPRHVRRPRLTRLLQESDAQAIVVTAPAGYGKTMLAAEWLGGRDDVAWYEATAAAADLAAFSTALADAVAAVVPGAGARLHQRVRVDETPEEAARPLAELLAEDLAAWPAGAWLVIDDYHLVADSGAVESFVDWLLTLAPIRLLVATRRRPSWATARRVLYGEITEIGRDELAMTREEAAEVVRERGDAVAALLERAQGWPAVIGLAGLSASFAAPRARISDALYRYFAEEVFRREPPEVQEFMLAGAVPAAVDPRTAASVLELDGAEDAAARLRDEGLMFDSPGAGLRFHPLLRDFLLRKLEADDPERRAGLAVRAIAAAREAGRVEEAFELAVESGDRDAAAELLAENVAELLEAGRLETVERRLEACGEAVAMHAELTLAQAEVLVRRGRLFDAAALAHDLAVRLPDDDPRASAAWHLAARSFHLLSEDERALDCHLRASEVAATPDEAARALYGAIVLAAQLETHALDQLVERIAAVASASVDARLQLLSARVFVGSRMGSLAGIWDDAEPLLHRDEEARDPMARTSFLIAVTYVAVSRGDYARAHELASRSVAVCDEFRLGRMKKAFCLCHRASAEIGLRRLADAERTLDDLAALGIDRTHVLVGEQRNLRAKLLLARGDLRELLDVEAHELETSPAAVGEHAALVAVAAAADGDAARARAEARRARRASTSIETRHYARLALLLARLGGGEVTDRIRREAVELALAAIEAEVLDALVIGYRAQPLLLEVLSGEPRLVAILRELVTQSNDHALAKKVGLAPARPHQGAGGLTLLTPRENEVLELISQGLGNAEIARRLFISEKTAKVHVYHIFEKLGVQTRVQAVLAARDALAVADA